MAAPILAISDRAETIDILNSASIHVRDWQPQTLSYQDGGVKRSSPLGNGARMSMYRYGTIMDIWQLHIHRESGDELIRAYQDLDRLLQRGVDYWVSGYAELPTYIIARSSDETNTRYAVVYDYRLGGVTNPNAQPIFPSGGETPSLDSLTLQIEHGPWRSVAPGSVEDVDISSTGTYGVAQYGRSTGIHYQPNAYAGTLDSGHLDMYDEWRIANHRNQANITRIYVYDAAPVIWTLFSPGTALPWTLLPAIPATGDIIYFGIDSALANSGPFTNLVFDITSVAVWGGAANFTWEYYNGAAWVTIPHFFDELGTVAAGPVWQSFGNLGVQSLHWLTPTDFSVVAVNGVNGYWIRARLTLGGGAVTPPIQGNRIIYSATWNSVHINEDQLNGDIPNLLQINVRGPSWSYLMNTALSKLLGHFNRLIVGARSSNRGPFTSIINYADTQNAWPVFTTVNCMSARSTFAAMITSPSCTGRCVSYNPAGAAVPMATEVRFLTVATTGGQFKGTYHAFLRYNYTTGGAGQTKVRLRFFTDVYANDYFQTPTFDLAVDPGFIGAGNTAQVLDLGRVYFPGGDAPWKRDIYQAYIDTQVYHTTAAACLVTFGDLILIPVDEWMCDTEENVNSLSTTFRAIERDSQLHIDSAVYPKYPLVSLLGENQFGTSSSQYLQSQYCIYSPTPAHLQPHKDVARYPTEYWSRGGDMDLYFFMMRSWDTTPLPRDGVIEACAAVTLRQVKQYKALRGDR